MTPLSAPIVHSSRGELPVLLSVPHSGRDYPGWLVGISAGGLAALSALEDPLVDRLVWRAMNRGIGAVIATAPRAAIDCNRAEDDVDPAVVEGCSAARVSARARGGLGIVPGRTQHQGHLWRRPISAAELEARLDQAHRPYHAAIASELDALLARFGCALLIDCHSMPPPPNGVPPIVFGDCHGRSASNWVGSEAMRIARAAGFASGLNDPFAGGHITERHGRPSRGTHALQVEIDRRCYLDRRLQAPGPGFDRVAAFLETLAVTLGENLLARDLPAAAE